MSMPPQKDAAEIMCTLVDKAVASHARVYGRAIAISTERRPSRIANPPIMPPMKAPVEEREDLDEVKVLEVRKVDDELKQSR